MASPSALIRDFEIIDLSSFQGYSGIVLQILPFKEVFGTFGPTKAPPGQAIQVNHLTLLELKGALAGPVDRFAGRRVASQVSCFLIAVGTGVICLIQAAAITTTWFPKVSRMSARDCSML